MKKIVKLNFFSEGEMLPVEISSIKRSKSIKIYVKNQVIKITKPFLCSNKEALNFLEKNFLKVKDMYNEEIKNSLYYKIKNSCDILYLGKIYKINVENVDNCKLEININNENNSINFYFNLEKLDEYFLQIKKMFIKILKQNLKKYLDEYILFYEQMLNVKSNGYSIKNMTSRYGSCNVKTHKLNFNINLIFMEKEVIKSIVVHELAHILHSNHSKKFYECIYSVFPKYNTCKNWINENNCYLKIL